MNAKQKHDLRIVRGLLPRLFLIFGGITVILFALFDPLGRRLVASTRTQFVQAYQSTADYLRVNTVGKREEPSATPAVPAPSAPPASEQPRALTVEELAATREAQPLVAPEELEVLAPVEQPIAGDMPPPEPEPVFDLASIIRTPAEWPKTVVLKQPVMFPVIVNGRTAGTAQAAAGLLVKTVSVELQFITVQFGSGTKVLPLSATNFVEQAEAAFETKIARVPQPNTSTAASSSTADNSPPAVETPETKPASAGKINLVISSEKKRFDTERSTVSNTQSKTERWGYSVAIVNKSFEDLPNVEVRYQLVIKDETPGLRAVKQQRKSGSKTCELLKDNTTFAFDTDPVDLTKTQLASGWTYGSGAKPRSRDTLVGLWIRAYAEGKVIAEYSEPAGLRTREKWE